MSRLTWGDVMGIALVLFVITFMLAYEHALTMAKLDAICAAVQCEEVEP